eukprot:4884627-Pyramimonas_sp.AAC.1
MADVTLGSPNKGPAPEVATPESPFSPTFQSPSFDANLGTKPSGMAALNHRAGAAHYRANSFMSRRHSDYNLRLPKVLGVTPQSALSSLSSLSLQEGPACVQSVKFSKLEISAANCSKARIATALAGSHHTVRVDPDWARANL